MTFHVAPPALPDYQIGDLVARFMAEYPKVQVHLDATNRRVDVLGEGFDLALRVRFPPLENTDLVMRVLSASPQRLVGCPACPAWTGARCASTPGS